MIEASRSQLTSAAVSTGTDPDDATKRLSGRQYGYSFDYTGNRTSSAVDGRTVTYTNNATPTQNVNQIGQRTTPGYVDVTGWAPAASSVTVNSQTASRQGDYFFRSPTFGTMPAWQDLTVDCDFGGSETRHGFLAANPETYAYDDDGNLTADGRWHYTWDAENRLITMETISAAYGVGAPRQKLEFKYDYLGRRVSKKLSNWSAGAWALASEIRFLYSGWNLLGEYAASGSTLTLVRSYTWGLDLGGMSAGGAGGLLAIREAATGASYLPAYDGMGNLSALIDRANGTVAAAYEYSPFGETIRATGTYAATNPFRSATKYTDTETGLVYYGYRYYSPSLGRFINRDPIGESGGLNLYGFVGNSPTNAWDLLGLQLNCVFVDGLYVSYTKVGVPYKAEWREIGRFCWESDPVAGGAGSNSPWPGGIPGGKGAGVKSTAKGPNKETPEQREQRKKDCDTLSAQMKSLSQQWANASSGMPAQNPMSGAELRNTMSNNFHNQVGGIIDAVATMTPGGLVVEMAGFIGATTQMGQNVENGSLSPTDVALYGASSVNYANAISRATLGRTAINGALGVGARAAGWLGVGLVFWDVAGAPLSEYGARNEPIPALSPRELDFQWKNFVAPQIEAQNKTFEAMKCGDFY